MTRSADPNPRFAVRRGGHGWDPTDLTSQLDDPDTPGLWALWHCPHELPGSPALTVSILAPHDHLQASDTDALVASVEQHLRTALGAYGRERGWPLPAFQVDWRHHSESGWSYRGSLGSADLFAGELQKGMLLAFGDAEPLAGLLGLETLDPFMGLPAKWIAATQRERASHRGLDALFDEATLVATHTLHAVSQCWAQTFGFPQLGPWLGEAVASRAPLVGRALEDPGILLETLQELIAADLWLPPTDRFVDLFVRKRSLAGDDPWMLLELVRSEVVPFNLPRWQDSAGSLWAVEWLDDADAEVTLTSHRLRRLEYAVDKIPPDHGVPVILTDLAQRRGLNHALRHAFPAVPVLSWQELDDGPRLTVVAVVDARMEFDPSPWPGHLFEFQNF